MLTPNDFSSLSHVLESTFESAMNKPSRFQGTFTRLDVCAWPGKSRLRAASAAMRKYLTAIPAYPSFWASGHHPVSPYLASAIISMIAPSTSCATRAKAGESESAFSIADGFIMPIFVLPPSE